MQNISDIIDRINRLRDILSLRFNNVSHSDFLYKGSRWNDNNLIIEKVFEIIIKKYKLNNFTENQIIDFIKTINQQQFDIIIIKSLMSQAYSDYYYKYEKDY